MTDPWVSKLDQYLEAKLVEQISINSADTAPPEPFVPPPFMRLADLDGVPVPKRRWLVDDLLPAANVGLLSGHGGTGKSTLMLQLAAGTALGRSWLSWIPTPGPAIVVGCEDDEDELHARLAKVAQFHGASFRELAEGGLMPLSLAGQDAVLGAPTRNGLIRPTPLFDYIYETAVRIRPAVITLDNATDVYAGEEQVRPQVRQFITLCRRLAIASGAHVLISLHPSIAGMRDDTGLSGSTAWFNSVRSQIYLKSVKTEEGEEPEPDTRELEARKNQYGALAKPLRLRWKDGLFLPEQDVILGPAERAASQEFDNDLFLEMLREFTRQGRHVGAVTGTIYAPALFAAARKSTSKQRFAGAMERLLEAGTIRVETYGPVSRQRSRLTVA